MLKGNRTERRGFQLSLLIWLQEEGGKEREPKFLSPDSQKTRTDVGILYPTTCSQRLVYFSHWNVIKLEQNHWNPGYSAVCDNTEQQGYHQTFTLTKREALIGEIFLLSIPKRPVDWRPHSGMRPWFFQIKMGAEARSPTLEKDSNTEQLPDSRAEGRTTARQ